MPLSQVEWLLRDATDERPLPISARVDIDDDSWRASIERLQIGPGLRVFLTEATTRRDVTVEARDDRQDQWIGSQVTVAGRAEIDFRDGAAIAATADRALLFRPSGRRAAYTIGPGETFHSMGFGLEIGRVARLLDESVPEALHRLLEPQVETTRILTMPGDRLMTSLAATFFTRRLNGPLRSLMMEGAVIQLLALQAGAVSERQAVRARRGSGFSGAERDALQAARDLLLADMIRPPTLGELSAAVGLSEKRLNAGFKRFFGATVFETLRNHRLEHARIALAAEKVSMRDVSARVGYNHVTNFVNAFRRRYGAPPRQFLDGRTEQVEDGDGNGKRE